MHNALHSPATKDGSAQKTGDYWNALYRGRSSAVTETESLPRSGLGSQGDDRLEKTTSSGRKERGRDEGGNWGVLPLLPHPGFSTRRRGRNMARGEGGTAASSSLGGAPWPPRRTGLWPTCAIHRAEEKKTTLLRFTRELMKGGRLRTHNSRMDGAASRSGRHCPRSHSALRRRTMGATYETEASTGSHLGVQQRLGFRISRCFFLLALFMGSRY